MGDVIDVLPLLRDIKEQEQRLRKVEGQLDYLLAKTPAPKREGPEKRRRRIGARVLASLGVAAVFYGVAPFPLPDIPDWVYSLPGISSLFPT